MIRNALIFLGLSLFFSTISFAQIAKDVFPLSREFKNYGLYISPQATVSFGNKEELKYSNGDSVYNYTVEGRGKWGYGLEVGGFRTFDNLLLIDFVEAAVSYRVFKGAAEHDGLLTLPFSQIPFESENSFSNQILSLSVRAVNAKQLGAKSFLTTALGLNYNYQIAEKYERSNPYPNADEEFLNKSTLQAHLQVGVGFKVSRQLLLIPTVETPIITAVPTDNLNPAFPFFDARYQPLIIGLKFMFLWEDPENCNAPTFKGIPTM